MNLFVKAPKVDRSISGDPSVTAKDSKVGDVTGIFYVNNGFNAWETEALVYVQHPSSAKRTEVLALDDVVELTQEEWEAEKPNYPN